MEIDRILEEYRQGDVDRRMSLFLSCRELRDDFAAIEREHPSDLFDLTRETPEHQGILQRLLVLLKRRSFWLSAGRSRADANL